MEARRWRNRCLRSNIVKPEDVHIVKKTKIAFVESDSPQPKKYKIDRELVKAIEAIAPEWWGDETRICINRNVKCEGHKDCNKGHSYVLWLGDFTGGALLFDDGTKIEEKTNGTKLMDKYSIGTSRIREPSIVLLSTWETEDQRKQH